MLNVKWQCFVKYLGNNIGVQHTSVVSEILTNYEATP